jgi:hypothetical protein
VKLQEKIRKFRVFLLQVPKALASDGFWTILASTRRTCLGPARDRKVFCDSKLQIFSLPRSAWTTTERLSRSAYWPRLLTWMRQPGVVHRRAPPRGETAREKSRISRLSLSKCQKLLHPMVSGPSSHPRAGLVWALLEMEKCSVTASYRFSAYPDRRGQLPNAYPDRRTLPPGSANVWMASHSPHWRDC